MLPLHHRGRPDRFAQTGSRASGELLPALGQDVNASGEIFDWGAEWQPDKALVGTIDGELGACRQGDSS